METSKSTNIEPKYVNVSKPTYTQLKQSKFEKTSNHAILHQTRPLMIKNVYFVRVLIIYTNVMNFKKLVHMKGNTLLPKIDCASIIYCKVTQPINVLILIAVNTVKVIIIL